MTQLALQTLSLDMAGSSESDELFQQAFSLHQSGDLTRAIGIYRQLNGRYPSDARILFVLGAAEYQSGNVVEGISLLERSLQIGPNNAQAHNFLGNAYRKLGRFAQALEHYERAVDFSPDNAITHNDRGIALRALGRLDEALASYRRAVRLNSAFVEAHNNIGVVMRDLGRFDEEVRCYDRAIQLNPAYAIAHNNRGIALDRAGRPDEALESYDRALQQNPDDGEIHNNKGVALSHLGRFDEALACVEKALRFNAGNADALYNKSMLLLRRGDFVEGWKLYEQRWKTRLFAGLVQTGSPPLWLGSEPLAGRRMLVWAEQGLGDALQFCRYVPLLARRGAQVTLLAPQPLARLLRTLDGVGDVIEGNAPLHEFDCHCPLMSLPLAFGTTLETVPSAIPYLRGDARMSASWRQRLGATGALQVGLAWSGGVRAKQAELWSVNERRNVPLGLLEPLRMPGIEFLSLQKGDDAVSQIADLESSGWRGPKIADFTHEFSDLADTAAFVDNLDLVISVDTAVAHLAGALGKPVWLLNRYDTCWRWLLDRTDSPWYPSMTIFRQPAYKDWMNVASAVAERLRQAVLKR